MLDRVATNVARATIRWSAVAPGSDFPPHDHGGGEVFPVLDGVFLGETGGFPAGS